MGTFEDRVAAWLAKSVEVEAAEVERLRTLAASLPREARHSSRWSDHNGFAFALVVAGLASILVVAVQLLSFQLPPGDFGSPGYPIARDDPRFERCAGNSAPILAAFPMAEARDFSRVFPNAGRVPELEVSVPAFVVVFEGRWPGPLLPRFHESPGPMPTLAPGRHAVCVWLGESSDADSDADYVVYDDIDIMGMDP